MELVVVMEQNTCISMGQQYTQPSYIGETRYKIGETQYKKGRNQNQNKIKSLVIAIN